MRPERLSPRTRRRRQLIAGAAAVAPAAWLARHATSPAVRGWSPPDGRRLRAGGLAVRVLGEGARAVVLLHGLTGSGDGFGAGFDVLAEDATLVAPDLLGFGGSMSLTREDFSLEAHLDALDAMLADLGLDDVPLTIAGHSMGAVLALHWAARRSNCRRVVTFSAPLYCDSAEARAHVAQMGLLERFFALETPLAAWTCALMCRYRHAAAWAAVALSPEWPVSLARQGVLHTWRSYLGGMNEIIIDAGWEKAVAELNAAGVPVLLTQGRDDPVPVQGRGEELARRYEVVETLVHPVAGHDLAVSYPDWCVPLLRRPD
jgi:pimeloyl-ACP methyl ester carboxylesterase